MGVVGGVGAALAAQDLAALGVGCSGPDAGFATVERVREAFGLDVAAPADLAGLGEDACAGGLLQVLDGEEHVGVEAATLGVSEPLRAFHEPADVESHGHIASRSAVASSGLNVRRLLSIGATGWVGAVVASLAR